MMDDAELLRAYAEKRSETAFAEFVERRIGFVHAAALRMVGGNAHTAQDVTQAVFALAANKAAALARHERLAGWLHMATRNVSSQTMREARRRAAREQEAARMSETENENNSGNRDPAGDAGIETRAPDCASGRLRPMLDDALGALHEAEREAVLLRYFEGRTFGEIGMNLKMSEEAARKRVARAVEKMRATFARRGVTSSVPALGALMTAEAAQAAPAGLAASVSAGALAAGGATVTTATIAAAFLAFMSSSKITTVAVVALLIAAGGAYYGVQTERASSTALAQARLEHAKLAAQLRELEKQSAATGVNSAPAARHDLEAAGQAFLANHPDLQEKKTAYEKSSGARTAFRISHGMNLSPEQSARLAEITNTMALSISSRALGHGDVMLRFGKWQPESKRKQELRDLLGDGGYEKYRELRDLDRAGTGFIEGVGSALYFTDAPLTSQQARSLEKIALDLEKSHAVTTDPEARWSELVERARPVLSPEQMRALVAAGDRYVWTHASVKWLRDYDEARTVTTATNPSR